MTGQLAGDVTAKDLMIALMAGEYFRGGRAIGQVLEFAGPALAGMSLDERAVLTNMSVEAGAFTGIIEADELVMETLCRLRGITRATFEGRLLRSDPDAEYAHRIDVDLSRVKPMVATPGDPRNGIAIDNLPDNVRIDIAYAGSCTGAKKADMDMYARVLGAAAAQGKRVHPDVSFYLQFGSQKIKAYAESRGYLEIFEQVGAQLVNPSCGACINAGPGASTDAEQVTVSAINRNYPGRSGPGKVYLASPLVVAASAIAGRIVRPSELLG
jgi:3-isopropylmalate/(R)-2-methylmalate dehydratase large subunit